MTTVHADIKQLDILKDDIMKTSTLVDNLIQETEDSVRIAQNRIDSVLYVALQKEHKAQERLAQAESALRTAQELTDDKYVPLSLVIAVEACQASLDKARALRVEIERAKYEYDIFITEQRRQLNRYSSEYNEIVRKSGIFLSKYIAALIASNRELSLGNSNDRTSVSNRSSHGQPNPNVAAQSNNNEKTASGLENDVPVNNNSGSAENNDSGKPAPAWFNNKVRQLRKTNQSWVANGDKEGTFTFDSPQETGLELDANQGKDRYFLGTCGIVSCVNILRLAGFDISEQTLVRPVAKARLCTTNSHPMYNGATSANDRKQILAMCGIDSVLLEANIANIAHNIEEGRGVIISVYAGKLWQDFRYLNMAHAVIVTSVKKDRLGNVIGFYVCDSGRRGKHFAQYYTAGEIKSALTGKPMNVTKSIIR